jgi:hypothetical protein
MLSTENENHAVNENAAASRFQMQVYGDSSTVRYDIFVDSARAFNDYITGVELRLGTPIMDNGTLLMSLPGKFPGPSATGILNLRKSLIDTLLNKNIDVYVTVLSRKYPTGLMRGQLNSNIIFSAKVVLVGENVVPGVTTATNGMAYIRLVEESRILYYQIMLQNNEPSDMVDTAKIFKGASGMTGTAFLTLAKGQANFNKPDDQKLTQQEFQEFLESPLYLSVNSPNYPGGKIRGQLK